MTPDVAPTFEAADLDKEIPEETLEKAAELKSRAVEAQVGNAG